MRAVFSGQSGAGVVFTDEGVRGIRAGSSESVICARSQVRHLLADADDVSECEVESVDAAQALLNEAWHSDTALQLLLLTIDPAAGVESRSLAGRDLEELLASEPVFRFVRDRFYAAPLPGEVLESSTLYAHAGPKASEIAAELVGRQAYIARVREAWDQIPAERFPIHQKELCARAALRSGLFRNLAAALEASRMPDVNRAVFVRLLRETGALQPDAAAGFVLDWAIATAGGVADVAVGEGARGLRPSRGSALVRLTSRIREWLSDTWSPQWAAAVLATCAVIIVASIALRFLERDARDYATALKYANQGHYAEASSLLKEVAARSNKEKYRAAYRDFCERLGLYYKQTGDLTKARAELNEALRIQPGYRPARVGLAAVEIAAKNYTQALNSIQDLIPSDEGAALLAASAYMSLNRPGDAKSLIDEALRKNSNSVPAHVELGYFLLASKQYKEAEPELLLGVSQYGLPAIQPLVKAYLGQGKQDDAIAALQAARQKAPNRMDVVLELGAVAVRTAKYDLAISAYNSALSSIRDPRLKSQIYVRLSQAYQAAGKAAQSLTALDVAYRLNPGNTSVALEFAIALDAARNRRRATELYEQVLEEDKNNVVALNNLAFTLASEGSGADLDRALNLIQRAIDVHPSDEQVQATLGTIYLRKRLSADAERIYSALVKGQPGSATYRYGLALALTQLGDRAAAMREAKAALGLNPSAEVAARINDLIRGLS